MQKKILVTGGAGYIGSQTCKTLKSQGYIPVVYDNLSRGHDWAIKWGPFVKGNISETERLVRTMNEHQVDAVIHFAAYAYVGESVIHPEMYFENNVGGTLSLLRAMQRSKVDKIVFSSTCATYGIPSTLPITEDHPQNPINPYGESKVMVEKMLRDCAKAWGLKSIALRYFNAAGGDLDGEIGETHDPETHLIPLVIQAGLKDSTIQIFGNDYETNDGTCVRDYVHVQDLAHAHCRALERLQNREASLEVFNLGTGRGYSVLEVIEKTSALLGKKIKKEFGPRRPGDPAVLVADPTKAEKILQWKAQHSDLGTLLKSALRWSQKST